MTRANLAYQVLQIVVIFKLGQELIDRYMLFVKWIVTFQIGICVFKVLAVEDLCFLLVIEFVEKFETVVHLTQDTSVEARAHVTAQYSMLVVWRGIEVALGVTKGEQPLFINSEVLEVRKRRFNRVWIAEFVKRLMITTPTRLPETSRMIIRVDIPILVRTTDYKMSEFWQLHM